MVVSWDNPENANTIALKDLNCRVSYMGYYCMGTFFDAIIIAYPVCAALTDVEYLTHATSLHRFLSNKTIR